MKSPNITVFERPPTGDVIIDTEDINASARVKRLGYAATRLAKRRGSTDKSSAESTISHVDMNNTGLRVVGRGEDGIVATSGLGGCTGVAGLARSSNGRLLSFVSHYDAVTQSSFFNGGRASPANNDIYSFLYECNSRIAQSRPIVLVAPSQNAYSNSKYGQRQGNFNQWYYLDQLETTARQISEQAQVILMPYDRTRAHTLASGRIHGQEGIFWDGVAVNSGQT